MVQIFMPGGSFTTMAGVSRNYLAKLNNTTGAASNWATANSTVEDLLVDGSNMYLAGSFTQISSVNHNRVAGVIISSGNLLSFNPDVNSTAYTLAKSGTTLYVGGAFTLINGTTPQSYSRY
jgi:hypothetical protein